ncbi:hypothetical protein GCM10009665_04670 [Kitasatospora nipponensis]|uniref:Uncharacterized protein n=1 Tax=Kitasatospora nipponensis TaxID=258049 RepID=A0ABN1VRD3_9ACTN
MTPAVPLAALGLIDAAFSGFRAYAGRDARIRRFRATARAALRGLAVGAVLLLVPALRSRAPAGAPLRALATGAVLLLAPAPAAGGVLLAAADRPRTYALLTHGGTGYLLPLALYAALVLLSLAAYFLLPFRAGTLAVVVGLGPLTLLRPLVVALACAAALANGGGPPSLLVGTVAALAVLLVGPLVHHRWYREVLPPEPIATR